MLLELMEMFLPLIGYIMVLQKRFNQFEYELGKSNLQNVLGYIKILYDNYITFFSGTLLKIQDKFFISPIFLDIT